MASLQTEVDSGALESAFWKTRSPDIEWIARTAIRGSITVNVVASMGTLNTGLLPTELTYLQQAVAILMWAILIYASAFVRPRLRLQFNPDLIALVEAYKSNRLNTKELDEGIHEIRFLLAESVHCTCIGCEARDSLGEFFIWYCRDP